MKFVLLKKATGENYSIEAGIADNIKNFDHHGNFSNFPAPCDNKDIPIINEDSIVEITHLDADTLLGIFRLKGMIEQIKGIDFSIVSAIDSNGSKGFDRYNINKMYMVGINEFSKEIGMLRPSDVCQDVTEKVEKMIILARDVENVIAKGLAVQKKAEEDYVNCLYRTAEDIGMWVLGENDYIDPSRPYEDGINVVVIFRKAFNSISIYANPSTGYVFGGKTICGINFQGHAKACGSPRGKKMTEFDAYSVFIEIITWKKLFWEGI